MKKIILIIIACFLIIMCALFIALRNKQAEIRSLNRQNSQYEVYLNKQIYGTELASLINKATDNNEKNNVKKDKSGFFIENNENSIKIEVNMKTIEQTYQMEQFYSNDITKFVQNFNQIKFQCVEISYNTKGKVNKLVFEELQEVDEI